MRALKNGLFPMKEIEDNRMSKLIIIITIASTLRKSVVVSGSAI